MPKAFKSYQYLLLILLFLSLSISSYALTIPERPSNYVTDLADIIPIEKEQKINNLLKNLEDKTTAQLFILTLKSMEGNSIETLSMTVVEKWRPGQKGKDNGVLITIALKERAYRIEVGYGLEGLLPDSLVGTIGRQILVPHFKEGNYGQGLLEASQEIALIIAQSQGVELNELKGKNRKTQVKHNSKPRTWTDYLLFGLFAIIFIYLLINHPELLLFFLMSSSSRGGGSWSSGGGFGGGGGGSFGGGGASGRW
ncbi:MAG: TPM domain-containing protein [Thermodesulfovibrionales bacterium]|nr:TPM domain-containing protein [Thermodesulfovibrionales bacterium]